MCKLTDRLIVRLGRIPDGVVDNITSKNGKGNVRHQFSNRLVHAFLQAGRRIALVVTIGSGRVLGVARGVILGVSPEYVVKISITTKLFE